MTAGGAVLETEGKWVCHSKRVLLSCAVYIMWVSLHSPL